MLFALVTLTMSCAARTAPPPALPKMIIVATPCLWPEPIVFTLDDDDYQVCFYIPRSGYTREWHCTTVGALRALVRAPKAN